MIRHTQKALIIIGIPCRQVSSIMITFHLDKFDPIKNATRQVVLTLQLVDSTGKQYYVNRVHL